MSGHLLLLNIGVITFAIIAGLIIKVILALRGGDTQITFGELFLGSLLISFVFVPITNKVGYDIAWNNTVTYNEYLNGWELQAVKTAVPCSKDGPCAHEYDCDPYQVEVQDPPSCSGSGENEVCTPRSHWETRYHSCPYVATEFNYSVLTTLGEFPMEQHRFPTNFESSRWYSPYDSDEREYSSSIPSSVVYSAGVGDPDFWSGAQSRLNAGNPGPVTMRSSYQNYILASDSTILHEYSDKIEYFKGIGALPALQTGIRDYYLADKVYFVGLTANDASVWQSLHSRLNSALGDGPHGDFHLVIVAIPQVISDPDGYITALKAYWSDPKVFGHDAISKNTVIAVFATTDGKTVSWARAETGMPVGNETMMTAFTSRFSNMHLPLTASAILGNVTGTIYQKSYPDGTSKTKVKANHNEPTGSVERILWGLDDPTTAFVRISMSAKDKEDIGTGFKFLADQIQPSLGQIVLIALVSFCISMLVWVVFALIDLSEVLGGLMEFVPFFGSSRR